MFFPRFCQCNFFPRLYRRLPLYGCADTENRVAYQAPDRPRNIRCRHGRHCRRQARLWERIFRVATRRRHRPFDFPASIRISAESIKWIKIYWILRIKKDSFTIPPAQRSYRHAWWLVRDRRRGRDRRRRERPATSRRLVR